MKRLSIEDTDVLYKIIDTEEYPTGIAQMVRRLRTYGIYVLMNEEETALMVFEPVYGPVPWYNCHVYTTPECRGKKMVKFYCEAGLWMVYNGGAEVLTVVVPAMLGSRHSLWMAHMGFEKKWELEGDSMWITTIDTYEKFEERLRKLGE